MVSKLSTRISVVADTAEDIRTRLARLRGAVGSGSRREVFDQLTALAEHADALRAELAQFSHRPEGTGREPARRPDEADQPADGHSDAAPGPVLVNANTH